MYVKPFWGDKLCRKRALFGVLHALFWRFTYTVLAFYIHSCTFYIHTLTPCGKADYPKSVYVKQLFSKINLRKRAHHPAFYIHTPSPTGQMHPLEEADASPGGVIILA